MRARLTLTLTAAAVALTLAPAAPVGARTAGPARATSFAATAANNRHVELVARLRVGQRARLAEVADLLTADPPPLPPPPPAPAARPAIPAVPDPTAGAKGFIWPAKGPISSPFGVRWGRLHAGVDIDAGNGSAIGAAQAGTVTFAGWETGYGNTVVIDHGQGISTLYAHQSKLAVRTGQHVSQGEYIGNVGATGDAQGAHLHYEVHVNGVPRNPMPWL